jgi:hypothetical protein
LLNESISDDFKIKLIDKDDDNTFISVTDKYYSDELCSYILKNRFEYSDLNYITDNYEDFGKKSKHVIVKIAIAEIDTVQSRLDKVSRSLLTAMFESKDMDVDIKEKILLLLAISSSDDETKKWQSLIN